MAKFVVDSIKSTSDIVDLIGHLARMLADSDTWELVGEGTVTLTRASVPTIPELEDIVRFDDDLEGQSLPLASGPQPHFGPTPLVPCTQQGLHSKLTDCWMCWSDERRH
jgi:hypothetical protein